MKEEKTNITRQLDTAAAEHDDQTHAAHESPAIPGLEQDRVLIARSYRNLLKSLKTTLNAEDHNNIRAAFELAAQAHQTQRRKSGEPYITHPIEVARICVEEIGLGPTAVICALLHDVVEDTDVTLKEIHDQFGDKIARIVDGLTKLDGLHDSQSPQAENLSKVLKAMLFDVRVVLIKMADRLHNLRTIKSMAQHKQLKIAAETSFIYTPLAHRLGLYAIKNEFQDTCFKITHKEVYHDIASKLSESKRSRQLYIDEFTSPLEKSLKDLGIPFEIVGRPKSIFSIYNKIKTKHVPFEDIYDLFAVRIVLDVKAEQEKSACWQVYSIVTDTYPPITQRIKDWISIPKANGYESLHATVVGPGGRYVEVQIRSKRMDDIAERGFAAHWKYKGIEGTATRANNYENWLGQVRESLENEESGNAVEFLADFQSNLFSEEVHVFTPKGEMKILPDGATALDFAFSIHSGIGCTCRVVRVNNRIVPFTYLLENGDQVEIITDKNQKPSEDWLQFVVTSKAKNRIRSALKEVKREQASYGKEILERKLSAFKVPVEENCDLLAKFYDFPNRMEFLSAIYLEQVDLRKISKYFRAEGNNLVEKQTIVRRAPAKPKAPRLNPKLINKPEVYLNGEPGNLYKYSFAACCNPVAGDEIFGFILVQGGVKIHRSACPNADNLYAQHAHRILRAEWGNISKNDFLAEIVINGVDIGSGVISQLTNTLADLGINIRSFSISGEGGYFEGRVSMVVANTDHLQQALLALKKFDWVNSATRAD
ncbi:MAG: RelA/SpoT family protein [Saprospiraceae bacterium]